MRRSIHETLMDVAWVFSKRATCNRLSVGAVITRDTRVISSGWNGPFAGKKHCNHSPENPSSCTAAVHAEANALGYALSEGVASKGAILYSTHAPCRPCAFQIVTAKIVTVYYETPYRLTDGIDCLQEANIEVIQLERETNV